MQLIMTKDLKSWFLTLPSGGTVTIRMKTAAERAVVDKGQGEG